MTDEASITGLKAFILSKGIKHVQGKITESDIREQCEKINEAFPDKRALDVVRSAKELAGKFYMVLNQMEGELLHGEKVPDTREDQQTRSHTENQRRRKHRGME